MSQLVKFGILTKTLQDSRPLCASWFFGKAHRKGWRTKGDGCHGKRRDDDNKPGAGTSTYQLVSAHAGLVPQTSGRLTRGRICGTNVMVDHFSNFIYVHLITSISGKQTLATKKSYEWRAASYDVKVNRYHTDNGRYADHFFL